MSRKLCSLGVLVFVLAGGFVAADDHGHNRGSMETDLYPPNAKPGECYARVFVPPKYRTETERVLAKEASERLEVIPATYDWAEERVLVKEASERLEVIPATFGWVEERVLVKPASKRIEEVPARYETVTEQVLAKPAHTVWKKGRGPVEKVDNGTGEIMCLVEVPATYRTVTKRVLKSPATTREVDIPAEYKTIRKQVQKTPPSTRTVKIPAEYETVRVKKEVRPSEVRRMTVPAEYKTVNKTVMVSEGRLAWESVLCETNMSRNTIFSIQRALKNAGHDPGAIDGVIGSQTMSAITSFQNKRGLARGGLTMETIKALGVTL